MQGKKRDGRGTYRLRDLRDLSTNHNGYTLFASHFQQAEKKDTRKNLNSDWILETIEELLFLGLIVVLRLDLKKSAFLVIYTEIFSDEMICQGIVQNNLGHGEAGGDIDKN